MIVKIFSTLVGLLGATLLFWVGIAFEHRPAGWPNIEFHAGPFPIHLHLPDGPYARLDALLAAERVAATRTQRVEIAQTSVSAHAAKAEDVAQVQIRTVTRTIIKEVPTYVTAAADHDFPLSVGFVRVLDAGALGVDVSRVPGPAGKPDDSASPIAPSFVAAGAIDDFGICRANSERQAALQGWIKAEAAANH